MLTTDFSRSSGLIYELLTQPIDQTADTGFMSNDFHNAVLALLRGEKGGDVQQTLIDVSIALDRQEALADLRSFLKNSIDHLRFYAFRVLDQYGQAGNAALVLTDRLLGKGGLVETARNDFQEIKINVGHIASEQNQASSMYWRQRVKQFKYTTIDDFKYYTEAARFIIETTASTFSGSTSSVMNYTLNTKQIAEAQQAVIIKARVGAEGLSNHDLAVVNEHLLQEFLYEALEGASAKDFEKRLQDIIASLTHLKPFEDVYTSLSHESGRQWSNVKLLTEAFANDIVELRISCQLAIEELFNTMDYTELPSDLEIEKLVEPFVSTTKTALEAIKLHVETWLHALSANRKQLY